MGSIKDSEMDFYFKMHLVLFQELRFLVLLLCSTCLPPGSETPKYAPRRALASYSHDEGAWKISENERILKNLIFIKSFNFRSNSET